jgi:hypothetical protein
MAHGIAVAREIARPAPFDPWRGDESIADAYLKPVLSRPNLTVATRSRARGKGRSRRPEPRRRGPMPSR